MTTKRLLEMLKKGAEAWNGLGAETWGADFRGKKIPKGNYRDFDFSETNFSGVNLSGSSFISADFTIAYLAKAKFNKANLEGADFTQADLRETSFRDADLTYANFSRARLQGADLTGAVIGSTVFADTDLSTVIGLETVLHEFPSTIGIDTIYMSRGEIPESFLLECGVPESFITQMHALVGAEGGIQFYSCFISYSSKDEEFAKRLHGKMRDAHLRVWFAPEDMKGGAKVHEQIDAAIRIYDKLLIVLSPASMASEWVKTELCKAFKAERRDGRRKLFPVRLVDFETLRDWECFDADSGKDLAVELREYFIPDFSN